MRAGNPKGVAFSQRSTYLHTMTIPQVDFFAMSGADCVLSVVPMFHVMSWGLPFGTLMLGCKTCLNNRFMRPSTPPYPRPSCPSPARVVGRSNERVGLRRWVPCCWVVAEPGDVLKMFTDEGVTFSAGVPTIWQGIRTALEADPSLAEGLLLNRLACGGSAPAAEMMEWYLQTYDVTFLQAWGMTEVRCSRCFPRC